MLKFRLTFFEMGLLLLILCVLLVLAGAAFGQPAVPDNGPPQVPQVIVEEKPEIISPPRMPDSDLSVYHNVLKNALLDNRPAIIFVGHAGTNVGRKLGRPTLACQVEGLAGVPEQCILISVPHPSGMMNWVATLDTDATDAEIVAAIEGRKLAQRAPFFSQKSAKPDALQDAGSLPARLAFLKDMTSYARAAFTQQMFGWAGERGLRSRPVPRDNLEEKWNVPGGMEGIRGWRSDLYEYIPSGPRQFAGDSRVPHGFGWLPANRQVFDDGTVFADVLSYKGKIFEARVAEKQDGKWERYVAFKDVKARPPGYHGLSSKQCIECHSQTMTGGYSQGVVPGDDTVISKGIARVESGAETFFPGRR